MLRNEASDSKVNLAPIAQGERKEPQQRRGEESEGTSMKR
jgi:hypothetical protein